MIAIGGKADIAERLEMSASDPLGDIDPFQNAGPNHYDALALGL